MAKLNKDPMNVHFLNPIRGWPVADKEGGPLYDPAVNTAFTARLKRDLNPIIPITEVNRHINDLLFAQQASTTMDRMIRSSQKMV